MCKCVCVRVIISLFRDITFRSVDVELIISCFVFSCVERHRLLYGSD